MNDKKEENPLGELVNLAVECMGVAVSIIDTKGTLLYYNRHAAKILDRTPEYIGEDTHTHHQNPSTNKKYDAMLEAFEQGRTEPFHYEATPYGNTIIVTLSPIIKDGRFIGCIQSVQLKDEINKRIM